MVNESIKKKLLSEVTVEELLEFLEDKSQQIVQIEKCFEKAFKKLPLEAKAVNEKKEIRIAVIGAGGEVYDASFKLVKMLMPLTDDILNTYYLRNRFTVFETVNYIYIAAPLTAFIGPIARVGFINTIEEFKEKKKLDMWVLNKDAYYELYVVPIKDVDKITKVNDELYFLQTEKAIIAVQTGIDINDLPLESEEEQQEVHEPNEFDVSYV